MKRYVRIYMGFLRNTLIRDMEFRLNFFVWGIAMIVEMGIHLLFFITSTVVLTILQGMANMNGFSILVWFR